MKTKTFLVVAVAVVLGGAAANRFAVKRSTARENARVQAAFEERAAQEAQVGESAPSRAAPEALSPEKINALLSLQLPGEQSKRSKVKTSSPTTGTFQGWQSTTANAFEDPLARVALSFVGDDPEAEAYWIEAINDPSLSARERQDLIEDLNEEGFADPSHPTLADLPLIVTRLQLIERLAPDAMDDVNSEAFEEAKKDLEDMVARLAQQ